jgi:hypothetical protein
MSPHFSHPFLGTYEVYEFFDLGVPQWYPFRGWYMSSIPYHTHSYQYHVTLYHTMSLIPYHLTLYHTPPNCNNVVDSQKLKCDQGLRPSVTSLDGIFSQHMRPANTSVSPGRSWQYLSGQASLRKFIFSIFLPGHICRCSCSYLSRIYKGQ